MRAACLLANEKNGIRTVLLEASIQKMSKWAAAAGQPAAPYEGTFVAEAQVHQFHYGALVVDDELSIREVAKAILESQGYEVLTAAHELGGLNTLCTSPSRCDHSRANIRPAGRI